MTWDEGHIGSNIVNLAWLLGLSAVSSAASPAAAKCWFLKPWSALDNGRGKQLLFDVSALVTDLLIGVAMLPYRLVSALKPEYSPIAAAPRSPRRLASRSRQRYGGERETRSACHRRRGRTQPPFSRCSEWSSSPVSAWSDQRPRLVGSRNRRARPGYFDRDAEFRCRASSRGAVTRWRCGQRDVQQQ